jgi:hypothetical protein
MNITLKTEIQGDTTMVQLIQEYGGINSEQMFACFVLRHGAEYRSHIPASELEDILQTVRAANIPMFGDCPMGVDGQSFELTIENGMARSSYRWWLKPNEKWHVLSDIANMLDQLAVRVSGMY